MNTALPAYLKMVKGELVLHVYVSPNAKKECVMGMRESLPHISLKAPAHDGKANKALIRFLSKSLRVKQSALELVQGEKSRSKKIALYGLKASEIIDFIQHELEKS
ncbi:MAG: YggU family protein [Deltaproteobacteria bacterium CG_4_10_14_0_2_um_filter_43_8]|nr:MAG: YggU family protein [Deltaproteobacteria bacterium CG11_big_fil_rev_8_21_14_0_20_42_23]PJA20258.1 MAG: YggU family protein [Deltaproteobacteria bacterium CG_4_10_14_0_2_um_filter_43_8]PJC64040.1 MAG: YggU family protein [Deltaproteobacteria bacterium CG_4_9_14_0_2_um_filter_42_21]